MTEWRVVNVTPHTIDIVDADGEVIVSYPASGRVARCRMDFTASGDLLPGVSVGVMRYGCVDGLPTPEPSVRFIVSTMVMLAAPDRDDLLVVADEVRDDAGRVVGCRSLASHVEWG